MEREKNRPHPIGSGYLKTPGEEKHKTDQKEDHFLRDNDFINCLKRSNLIFIQESYSKTMCQCYIKVCLSLTM